MTVELPWLDFQYRDPEPNFDRSEVRGVAAKLFTVKDSKFIKALETVGGDNVSMNYFKQFKK
jgi:structural maintenance of chromosome 2